MCWLILGNICNKELCGIKFNQMFTHVSSCLIVKDIEQTVFRCTETIKKMSSAPQSQCPNKNVFLEWRLGIARWSVHYKSHEIKIVIVCKAPNFVYA